MRTTTLLDSAQLPMQDDPENDTGGVGVQKRPLRSLRFRLFFRIIMSWKSFWTPNGFHRVFAICNSPEMLRAKAPEGRILRREPANPSNSPHDENYYANDNYRSDDPVSEHFASPQRCCSAVVIGMAPFGTTPHSELARVWPLKRKRTMAEASAGETHPVLVRLSDCRRTIREPNSVVHCPHLKPVRTAGSPRDKYSRSAAVVTSTMIV